MDEEIKKELNKILDELPGENSWLDYKATPYKPSDIGDLVNDLSAFLNSEQSYGRNKYIIYGIDNKKNRRGIEPDEMPDDNQFQAAAKHIFPVPKIITDVFYHTFEGKEQYYGFVLICKDNTDRIYEVAKDTIKRNNNNLYGLKEIFDNTAIKSTAWIRIGSSKEYLDEYTRRKIYDKDNDKRKFKTFDKPDGDYLTNISNSDVIKTALLFGSWNENNINDIKAIEKYSKEKYQQFIKEFRQISKNKSDFSFKNGCWKIENREIHLEEYASEFYKEDFEKIKEIVVEVLKEYNPKLTLSPDKRSIANLYNKTTRYSNELRLGLSETITIIKHLEKNFENSKIDASNFVILAVREILNDSNSDTWASLDILLPYLAEACPSEFLDQLEQYLKNDITGKLFYEKEEGITTYNYATSIYWSLELIAWNTEYFVRVCMILAKIGKFDKEAVNHIVNIVLPWYPNTNAPEEYRIRAVENILIENTNIGWQLVKKLMPGSTTYAITTYKPRYINIPNEKIEVTKKEYYAQIDKYIDLMLKYCKYNNNRIIDLIDLLDNVSKNNFDKICNYLKLKKIKNKHDKSKYLIWDKIERMCHSINKYSKLDNKIKEEMNEKIKGVISEIKPTNNLYIISRLFKKDIWQFIEDNYDESIKELERKRIKSIEELYNRNGINSIIELCDIVEDTFNLGMTIASIKLDSIHTNKILSNLDKSGKLLVFSKGFVYKKYNLNNEKYNDELVNGLTKKAKLNFLLMLPFERITFEEVQKVLKEKSLEYWKKVDIRSVENEEDLRYSSKKLMEVSRYDRVLWVYRLFNHNHPDMKDNNEIELECLEKIDNNINQYDICETIKKLQDKDADQNRLFYIEWRYLPLLNNNEYRPITMEKALASDAEKYSGILELAFKERSKKKNNRDIDLNIATNAYRLLNQWKMVPGSKEDGSIDSKLLNKWYKDMQDICNKKDRLEVGLSYFGHVLFYASEDKSGFWINKTVANILNENQIVRSGYKNQAFNSVGVVNYDKEGSDYMKKYDEYKEKAEKTELEGYYNFATALREVAENFKFHAERMQDSYEDF